jgi:hypothetical protein
MDPRQPAPHGQDIQASGAGSDSAITRPYLTIEELSARTTLSVSTLRRLYKRGLIVGYQPGGPRTRIVFPAHALEQLTVARSNTSIPTTATSPESKHFPQRGPRPKWLGASEAGSP